MQHDVETVIERLLYHRRGKGVVGHADQLMAARDIGQQRQISQPVQRIGRRLHPQHAGVRTDGRFQRRRVVGRHIADAEAGRLAAHAVEQAYRAAVQIINRDNMAAGGQQIEHGGDGGKAGAERIAAHAVFQLGNGALQRFARRVLAARIFVAAMLARCVLAIGGGGVNRCDHGTELVVMQTCRYGQGMEIGGHGIPWQQDTAARRPGIRRSAGAGASG